MPDVGHFTKGRKSVLLVVNVDIWVPVHSSKEPTTARIGLGSDWLFQVCDMVTVSVNLTLVVASTASSGLERCARIRRLRLLQRLRGLIELANLKDYDLARSSLPRCTPTGWSKGASYPCRLVWSQRYSLSMVLSKQQCTCYDYGRDWTFESGHESWRS